MKNIAISSLYQSSPDTYRGTYLYVRPAVVTCYSCTNNTKMGYCINLKGSQYLYAYIILNIYNIYFLIYSSMTTIVAFNINPTVTPIVTSWKTRSQFSHYVIDAIQIARSG